MTDIPKHVQAWSKVHGWEVSQSIPSGAIGAARLAWERTWFYTIPESEQKVVTTHGLVTAVPPSKIGTVPNSDSDEWLAAMVRAMAKVALTIYPPTVGTPEWEVTWRSRWRYGPTLDAAIINAVLQAGA